jgi:hypothetical protein
MEITVRFSLTRFNACKTSFSGISQRNSIVPAGIKINIATAIPHASKENETPG